MAIVKKDKGGIAPSHYAAFVVGLERITDINGNLLQLNIDFQTGIGEARTISDEPNPKDRKDIPIDNYVELRSRLHLPKGKHKGQKVKQLRDSKGKFLSKSESKLIKDLSKRDKKSVKKTKDAYFTDQAKMIRVVEAKENMVAQHDIEDEIYYGWNKRKYNWFWRRKADPYVISVNITTFDGDTYSYSGTAPEIWHDRDFQDLITRELNRVYKTIQKTHE